MRVIYYYTIHSRLIFSDLTPLEGKLQRYNVWNVVYKFCSKEFNEKFVKKDVLIRYTICESLTEIQLSIMYENTQKKRENQGTFHNLHLHLTCHYIEIFISIKNTIYVVYIHHFRHDYSSKKSRNIP